MKCGLCGGCYNRQHFQLLRFNRRF